MKKFSILYIVIIASVCGSYILHFIGQSPSKPQAILPNKAIISAARTKVAYISTDSLYAYYNFYLDASKVFQNKQRKVQNQLQSRIQKLEQESISYQKRAEAGLMSENDIKKAQANMAKKQQELQVYQQTVSNGLLEEEKMLASKMLKKITDYLEVYNDSKQFDIILNYTPGNAFWYVRKGLDITQEVIDGLNEEYAKEELKSKTK